jgi:hypothetical protein
LEATDLSTIFSSSTIARFQVARWFSENRAYSLTAIGPGGEHYIATTIPGNLVGTVTVSAEAKAGSGFNLKLQLIDTVNNTPHGVTADFNLRQRTSVPWRVGRATNIGAEIEPIDNGWYRLRMTAKVPPGNGQTCIFVQLASNEGTYDFLPHGESLYLRHIKVERGATASQLRVNSSAPGSTQ